MPPSAPTASGDLAALRAEIDRIDDALHDLLMRRAEVVKQVATSASKAATPVALRPGREAAIIRRLLRRHRGDLPPQALVQIWRELLAAFTEMQRRFVVAVCEADPGGAITQVAREQFGALTLLHGYPNPAQALAELSAGAVSVAVLPLPDGGHDWWTALLEAGASRLYVVARLPFGAPRPDRAPNAEALVVASIAPDPSGQDRSLLGFTLDQETSRAHLSETLDAAGLAPVTLILRRDPGQPARALAEVDGFVTDEDPRLSRLGALGPVVLGAYAIPIDGSAA